MSSKPSMDILTFFLNGPRRSLGSGSWGLKATGAKSREAGIYHLYFESHLMRWSRNGSAINPPNAGFLI